MIISQSEEGIHSVQWGKTKLRNRRWPEIVAILFWVLREVSCVSAALEQGLERREEISHADN